MPTFELDETKEVVLPASKEVAAIEEMRNEIAEFMAPALEEEIDKAITEAKAVVTVTDEAGKEIAKSHATILQKARTQKVEKPHKKFKAPVTAISSALDGRKRTLSEKLEAEEDRVRALISKFDQAEEDKKQEALRRHREKIQGRINGAIKAGVQVDTDFAELASDDEWAAELRVAVEKKAKQDEVTSMVSRAAAQGFVLPADDIEHMDLLIAAGELANREAGLMVWLADAVKARTKQEAALRTERRMAQLEELGIEASLKAIRELGDAEWDALVAAALVPAEELAVASEPVLHADAPSPIAQTGLAFHKAAEASLTSGGTNPAASQVPTLAQVQAAAGEHPLMTKARSGEALSNPEMIELLGIDTSRSNTAFDYLADRGNIKFDEHRKGSSYYAHVEATIDGNMWCSDGHIHDGDWGAESWQKESAKYNLIIATPPVDLKAPAIEVLKKLAGFGKKHCSEKGELRTDFVEIFQDMKAYVEVL